MSLQGEATASQCRVCRAPKCIRLTCTPKLWTQPAVPDSISGTSNMHALGTLPERANLSHQTAADASRRAELPSGSSATLKLGKRSM
eukprot:5254990-Prymnesium_polylepis.1